MALCPPASKILDRCPACQGTVLYRVSDGSVTNYLCRSCDRCWHLEADDISQVSPTTCPGCEWRSRCLARWDVPRQENPVHGTPG